MAGERRLQSINADLRNAYICVACIFAIGLLWGSILYNSIESGNEFSIRVGASVLIGAIVLATVVGGVIGSLREEKRAEEAALIFA